MSDPKDNAQQPAKSRAEKKQQQKQQQQKQQQQQPKPQPKPDSKPAPKREQQAQPASEPAAQAQVKRGGKGALALSLLALLLAGGVGGAGYWGWMQVEQRLAESAQQQQASEQSLKQLSEQLEQQMVQGLSQQKSQSAELQQQMSDTLAAAEQEKRQLTERTQALSEQLAELQGRLLEISGRRPSDWLLAEASHLVRLAGRKLWLEGDVITSMALLASADERIRELNDPSLLPLRDVLSQDIATLRALPQPDTDGLVLRLSSLQAKVSELSPITLELPEALDEPEDLTLSESVGDWKQNLQKVWGQISADFITVQRRDGPVAPLLSPEQRWYLQENVRNKLIQAQQAVLEHEEQRYRQALTDAHSWIGEFYQPDDRMTQFMLQEIEALAEAQIEMNLPAELASQQPLEDLLRERVQKLIQTKGEAAL